MASSLAVSSSTSPDIERCLRRSANAPAELERLKVQQACDKASIYKNRTSTWYFASSVTRIFVILTVFRKLMTRTSTWFSHRQRSSVRKIQDVFYKVGILKYS